MKTRTALALALVALLAVTVWWRGLGVSEGADAGGGGGATEGAGATASAKPVQAATTAEPAAGPVGAAVAPPLDAASSAVSGRPPAPAATAIPPLGADCGWGDGLALATLDEADKARMGRALGQRFLAQLQQSPQPLDQALGWWLASTPFNIVEPGMATCPVPGCQTALARLEGRMERAGDRREEARRIALALVRGSHDPHLLALGVALCDPGTDGEDCRASLAQRWTATEPDNAAAWLALAQVARDSGALASEADALQQAAQAARFQPVQSWLLGELVNRLPAGWVGEPRLRLQVQMLGGVAGMGWSAMSAGQSCGSASLADANHLGVCDRLAQRLLRDAPDLQSFNVALALGQRIGWPAQRVQPLVQESERMRAEFQVLDPGERDSPADTCRRHQQGSAWIERSARQGELAHLRSLRRGG